MAMKRMFRFFAYVAMALTIASCDEVPPGVDTPIDNDGPLFKIEVSGVGNFTRATDTAFEVGDALSLFAYKGGLVLPETPSVEDLAGFSAWIDNGKFTKSEGGFVGDKEYKWYEGEDVSQIFALYPYNDKWNTVEVLTGGVSFCVQTDQSTHAGYTASDLMYAAKSDVAPTEESVKLEFNHLLSKIIIDVKNERTEKIVDAYLDGVQGNLSFRFPHLETTGDKGTIRAGELKTPSEEYTNSFALIIPAQKVAPKLAFVTDAGEQITFDAPEEIEFGTGKVRHLTVNITPKSISAEFDAIVKDWSADPDVEFKDQPGQGGDDDGDDDGNDDGNQQVAPFKLCGSDGSQTTFELSEEGIYTASLLVENAEVGYQLVSTAAETEGVTYGGKLVSTVLPVKMTEGSNEQIYIPLSGAWKVALNVEKMTLDITPWILSGGEYTYLGQGAISETFVLGITWDVDIMTNNNGSYVFLTPFGDLLDYVSSGNASGAFPLKVSESATPDKYILLTVQEATHKGSSYMDVNWSTSTGLKAITTGLMCQYDDAWYDLTWDKSDVTDPVPYNRAVGDGLFQTAPKVTLSGAGSFTNSTNSNGVITYLLPGRTMESAKYDRVGIQYAGVTEQNEAMFNIYVERHLNTFYIIPINREIYDEELWTLVADNINANAFGYNYTQSGEKDEWLNIGWTPEATGRYGMIILGVTADKTIVSANYCNYSYVKTGDSAPACEVMMEIQKDSARPDTQLTMMLYGMNLTSACYACMPNSPAYASLSDEEIVQKAVEHGYNYITGYLDYANNGGYSEVFLGLTPATEYLVVGWFTNDFGSSAVVRKTITTAPATQWTSLGIGRYQDASHFFGQTDSTRSAVEIMQASTGAPYYRVLNPYAGYWAKNSEGYIGHCGTMLELAIYDLNDGKGVTTRHICFDPHSTGLQIGGEEIIIEHAYNGGTSALKYPMRDKPESVEVYRNSPNRVISDKVFQLAPWYMVKDTNRGYNYSAAEGAILIVLPWEGSDQIDDEENAVVPLTRAFAPMAPRSIENRAVAPADGGGHVKGGKSVVARGRQGSLSVMEIQDSRFKIQN